MKNKVLSLLLIIVLIFIFATVRIKTFGATDFGTKNYNLDDITEEESIEFVSYYNIEIPSKIQNSHMVGSITQSIIQRVYNNPNCVFAYNYNKMLEYANSIKQVIVSNKLYKKDIRNGGNRYNLIYNTVKDSSGNWVVNGGAYDGRWEYYNCYAFAIHRNENPNYYFADFPYYPGDMADDEPGPHAINTFTDCNTISSLAGLVRKDLLAMGYTNVDISDTIPTINSSQELICVRMNDTDFHFMRYDLTTNAWYHKPGHTAVLKYNYVPSNNQLWYNECSNNGVEYAPTINYNSDIKFIKYDKNTVGISSNTSNLTYSLAIQSGKDSILEINNSSNNKIYDFIISASSSIEIELYDNEMELMDSYTGTYVTFCKQLSIGIFYLKVNFTNSYYSGSAGFNISAHSHNYSYDWVSYIQHRKSCNCGVNGLQAHVVSPDAYNSGQMYATCLLCGGNALINSYNKSQNMYPSTINGSFMLPNGVIVIVKEDIEAYIDGTLIFNYPLTPMMNNSIHFTFRRKYTY